MSLFIVHLSSIYYLTAIIVTLWLRAKIFVVVGLVPGVCHMHVILSCMRFMYGPGLGARICARICTYECVHS